MTNNRNEKIRIIMKSNRIITKSDLFAKKEEFHKQQAKLPFVEKIRILVQLQKIAHTAGRSSGEKRMIWKLDTPQGSLDS
ncbi:MAG: hypothetical protein IIB44_10685 [Candidatus Marinimicrobia bacterium]|nr:hypothetical protein [Candidatus Neomarinimicrobiota bacterium]